LTLEQLCAAVNAVAATSRTLSETVHLIDHLIKEQQ
jgi:hypothetical protein